MKLDNKASEAVSSYLEKPKEQHCIYELGAIYWSFFIDSITETIHNDGDVHQFIEQEENFLNIGIINEVLEKPEDILLTIKANTSSYNYLKIDTITSWLKDTIKKIYSGDKKDLLELDIKNLKIQQQKLSSEVDTVQEMRKKLLLKEFLKKQDKATLSLIDNLVNIDLLAYQNMQTNLEISKGVFFSVKDRREFVERTNRFQKETAKNDALFLKIKTPEIKNAIRKCNSQINDLFQKSINCLNTIAKKKNELDTIKSEESTLSALEVENRVRSELEYLRDLVKLCAKRLRIEHCSILRPDSKFYTIKDLCLCFDRILEFDPSVFNNDRVSIFGKPYILVVPGNGYGLYDWKYNRFIIPMVPQNGDFMTSIATAIIEYRLDVDVDKQLLTSYQKLPEQKGIRSLYALRSSLTNDYIKWMSSEYFGYKVLEKETRKWFEHEIAPSKTDIFCPPQFQPFALSTEEFRGRLKSIEEKLKDAQTNPLEEDLWTACILNYQQGKFKDSFKYINELLAIYPDHLFGYYNLGIIGMKTTYKQDAIKGFKEFMNRNPQSWWASVAREHIRRLQVG